LGVVGALLLLALLPCDGCCKGGDRLPSKSEVPLLLRNFLLFCNCCSVMDRVLFVVRTGDDMEIVVSVVGAGSASSHTDIFDSAARRAASASCSSLCIKSIALSTPSGNQYSTQAQSIFPSGDTSNPPSLYKSARGTKVRGLLMGRSVIVVPPPLPPALYTTGFSATRPGLVQWANENPTFANKNSWRMVVSEVLLVREPVVSD